MEADTIQMILKVAMLKAGGKGVGGLETSIRGTIAFPGPGIIALEYNRNPSDESHDT